MKLCVRDFSMLALKDPLFPAEVVVIGTSTTPPTAGVTLRRHQHCTSSQRSCSGFNFMLVYLSVRLVPVFFSVVYLQVSEHILWYSLLLCHQHWRDASNQALQGKVFCSPFPSSVSCCARVFPPPPLYFGWSILSLPGACSCPSYCPDFHFPPLFQGSQKSGASPCSLCAGPARLIAGFSPASNSVGVEQEITWLLSVLELLTVSQLRKTCGNPSWLVLIT